MDVYRRLVAVSKEACGLNDNIHLALTPRDARRVAFAEDGNGFSVNHKLPLTGGDVGVEFTEQRVVFQQMGQRFTVGQIVDGHNLNLRVTLGSTQYVATDTAKTVNTDLYHDQLLSCCL